MQNFRHDSFQKNLKDAMENYFHLVHGKVVKTIFKQ